MKDYEAEIRKIIFKHLPSNDYQVFLFGSRAIGKSGKFSDYDIGVLGKEPLPQSALGKINSELEESDIPLEVDVVDFAKVSPKFKKVSLEKIKLWKN